MWHIKIEYIMPDIMLNILNEIKVIVSILISNYIWQSEINRTQTIVNGLEGLTFAIFNRSVCLTPQNVFIQNRFFRGLLFNYWMNLIQDDFRVTSRPVTHFLKSIIYNIYVLEYDHHRSKTIITIRNTLFVSVFLYLLGATHNSCNSV